MDADRPTFPGEPRTIETLADFIAVVLDLKHVGQTNRSLLWFRGQGFATPELRPAVLRPWFDEVAAEHVAQKANGETTAPAISAVELQLNRDFRRLAASLLPADATLVDSYFLAQHHGMPTRLLDWTTNPMSALFFAVTTDREEDGVVVVSLPEHLLGSTDTDTPPAGRSKLAPFDVRAEVVVRTISSLFGDEDPPAPPMVLPVLPDLRAGRMLQQGSCFTLHMPGSEAISQDSVVQLLIPSKHKGDIEAGLRSLGVNWASLFPDLDHVSRELRSQWNLWPERRTE
jgi:FRG domain